MAWNALAELLSTMGGDQPAKKVGYNDYMWTSKMGNQIAPQTNWINDINTDVRRQRKQAGEPWEAPLNPRDFSKPLQTQELQGQNPNLYNIDSLLGYLLEMKYGSPKARKGR